MPESIGVTNRCRRPNHGVQAGSFDCTSCLAVLHNQRNTHTLGVHADGIQCSSVIQALASTRAAILSFWAQSLRGCTVSSSERCTHVPGLVHHEANVTMDTDPPESGSVPPSARSGVSSPDGRSHHADPDCKAPETLPSKPRPAAPRPQAAHASVPRPSAGAPGRAQETLPLGTHTNPMPSQVSASKVAASRVSNPVPRPISSPREGGSGGTAQAEAAAKRAAPYLDSDRTSAQAQPYSRLKTRIGIGSEIPAPERTPPQGFALVTRGAPEPSSAEDSVEKPEDTLPTEPPPNPTVLDRPSEQTRIFAPNLHDPKLKRSERPDRGKPETGNAEAIPREPKVPSGLGMPASNRATFTKPRSGALAETHASSVPLEDQTRTYSAETIDRLLHQTDELNNQKTPNLPSATGDEMTRVYSQPPEVLLKASKMSARGPTAADDLTRVFDSPAEGQNEREHTSPGKRARTESSIVIQAQASPHGKKRYVILGLLIAATAIGFAYRRPIQQQVSLFAARVARGMDSTRTPQQINAISPLVSISISVSPADARLTLDGTPVSNPLVLQRRPDKLSHELVAEAPGHSALKRTVQLDRDLTVMLGLAPLPVAVPTLDTAASDEAAVEAAAPASRGAVQRKAANVASRSSGNTTSAKRASVKAVVDCNPPYVLDANGIKSYKPECL